MQIVTQYLNGPHHLGLTILFCLDKNTLNVFSNFPISSTAKTLLKHSPAKTLEFQNPEEMLRSILRSAATAAKSHPTTGDIRIQAAISASSKVSSSRTFATSTHPKKPNFRPDIKHENAAAGAKAAETLNKDLRARFLKEDEKDKSLDIGPDGRSLFTSAASISELTKKDTCTYMKFRYIFRVVNVPIAFSLNCILGKCF